MRHSYNCSELLGQIRIWEVNINNSWIRRTLAIAENNQSGERTGICILTHACGSVKHNSDIIIVYIWEERKALGNIAWDLGYIEINRITFTDFSHC